MLEGAFNFRDLGGLPLAGGGRLREGRLYRSDTLQALTAADVDLLVGRLGLRTVVDLRLAAEVEGEGRGLLAGRPEVRFVDAPLAMARTEGIAPERVLEHLYEECLQSDSLPRAVERIAAHADAPTLFHCAAGKDRTGIVAALVLALAGVEREAIVADYLRSAAAMPRMIERFRTWPRYRRHIDAVPPQVYAVEEGPIRRVLALVDARHGGAAGWARANGIGAEAIAALRQAVRG